MSTNGQKRSSIDGMTARDGQAQGVGGRQPDRGAAGGGGGYPDICTTERSRVGDPRLAELRQVGLARHWLRVAQEIGVDNFLATWEILSSERAVLDQNNRVHIPSITSFQRYQRNKVIRTLAANGLTAAEIRQELRKRLGYDLTEGHIRDLVREAKE